MVQLRNYYFVPERTSRLSASRNCSITIVIFPVDLHFVLLDLVEICEILAELLTGFGRVKSRGEKRLRNEDDKCLSEENNGRGRMGRETEMAEKSGGFKGRFEHLKIERKEVVKTS
ncbi:hypothetical protein C5167_033274 [Papaver somniferum]|uniref:Uncharacterized protein n=1 Tax=Papaver somniferum TaxID=3469 RepID=A0A4Y7K9W2_PAPSO|nr:hypothetical protein C5167_033274 [Papaver somniferum]